MSSDWLNGIGLSLNVVGAVLIFFYGVPRYPTRESAGTSAILLEEDDPEERDRVRRADCRSKIGVGLLIAGFCVQFAALFV